MKQAKNKRLDANDNLPKLKRDTTEEDAEMDVRDHSKDDEPFKSRSGIDRRKKPTNPFSFSAYKGRRKVVRRIEDKRRQPYVDQYSSRLFIVCLLMLTLVIADGFLTVYHVTRGAVELNPLMDGLLQVSHNTFFILKYIISSLCVIVFVLYRYHPVTRFLIIFLTAVYTAVFINHMYHYLL